MDMQAWRRRPVALAAAFAILAAACSSGGSPTPTAPASSAGGSASTSAGASASVDPTAPYPSKSGTLKPVKIAQSVPALSFSPLLVAKEMNFFGYQGVDLQFVQLQSGATALQAVESGSINLVDSASTEVAGGAAQGLDIQAIENTIMMTLQWCVSKDWASQHNVTPDSSLQERFAAMKGATIGITGPGAVSDKASRFLLTKYGGLNPDTDTNIVQTGGAASLPGALDAGQVQAFLLSPPACGETKNGEVLVQPFDVPEFQNYTHEVLYTSKKWVTANKDIATAAATAVAMGNNFIIKYPDASLEMLKKEFPKVDPTIITSAFNDTIKKQIKPDGKFDQSMWEATNTVLVDAKIIDKPIDVSEGGIWTTEYISDPSVR
jgi:ABC-type nitrate/sulfonate/bicarbonate transport system substrate-binding protein